MENIKEIWKTIDEYPNYQVSNLGMVKSLGNDKTRKEKILKSGKLNNGYLYVILCKDGKVKKYLIHRLVASTFLDNPANLQQVNHKDEDKTNNMVYVNEDGSIDYNKSNLEYCDAKYNNSYGTRIERVAKANSISILQFSKEGEFIRRWNSAKEVEKELGIKNSSICSCCKGKRKSAYGYKWGYADDYVQIPFKVFDLEIYRKKVA